MSKEYLKIVNYDKGNLLQINVQDDEFTIIQLPLLDDEVDDVKAVIDKMNNALTELQAIKEAKPETLEWLNQQIQRLNDDLQHYTMVEKDKAIEYQISEDLKELNTIKASLLKAEKLEKEANAFELIILKNVDVNEIRPNATAKDYNSKIPYYRQSLTEEEFKRLKELVHRLDLLKEMLE